MAERLTRHIEWGKAVVAIATLVLVAWVNYRFVLVHFSAGGHLLDTGWFAWIMASGDRFLTNPSAIKNLSYFNYHLSPWLSGVSMAAHAIGLDRFDTLAIHQSLMFAALAAALLDFALRLRGAARIVATLAVVLLATTGDLPLQIASYPHFEIAILSFCALGLAFGTTRHPLLGTLSFLLAIAVREDAGLYVAVFVAALAACLSRPLLLAAAVPAVAASVAAFWAKAVYFPGFSAFAYNYSGNSWDHLTSQFVAERLSDFAQNPIAMATLLVAVALGTQSKRALVVPLLFVPLLVAQLLAARPQLGHFRLYYALPFLGIWVLNIAALSRWPSPRRPAVEAGILLAGSLAIWGPVQFALSPPSSFPVFAAALSMPVTNLPQLAAATEAALVPDACVSKGVAALVPNAVTGTQVIAPEDDLTRCQTVYLFRSDLDYPVLQPRMADRIVGPVIDGRVERYDQRP